jgi:hypothetical protein
MRANDQMPESLRRTIEIEKAKTNSSAGGKLIQKDENSNKTKEIEKEKNGKGGAL